MHVRLKMNCCDYCSTVQYQRLNVNHRGNRRGTVLAIQYRTLSPSPQIAKVNGTTSGPEPPPMAISTRPVVHKCDKTAPLQVGPGTRSHASDLEVLQGGPHTRERAKVSFSAGSLVGTGRDGGLTRHIRTTGPKKQE